VCVSGENISTPHPPLSNAQDLVDNKGSGRNLFAEPTISMTVNNLHTKSQNSAYCFQWDRLRTNQRVIAD
jgi:hypothetical protein